MRLFFILVLFFILLTPSTFAEESHSASPESHFGNPKEITKELRQQQEEKTKEMLQNHLETRIEKMETKMTKMDTKLASKEAMKAFHENRKETLKTVLNTFKDKVKSERVDRINTILATVNANKTASLSKNLDKMNSIITRLETQLTLLEKEGKDTAAARQTISDAKTAIETANHAVTAQAANDYTLAVSSEATAKADALKSRQILQSDLENTQKLVTDAKEKLITAVTTTKLLIGGTPNE